MLIFCAWHVKYFGEPKLLDEKPPYENKDVTHGICPDCVKKAEEQDADNPPKPRTP